MITSIKCRSCGEIDETKIVMSGTDAMLLGVEPESVCYNCARDTKEFNSIYITNAYSKLFDVAIRIAEVVYGDETERENDIREVKSYERILNEQANAGFIVKSLYLEIVVLHERFFADAR